jgi:hypothetical protein
MYAARQNTNKQNAPVNSCDAILIACASPAGRSAAAPAATPLVLAEP